MTPRPKRGVLSREIYTPRYWDVIFTPAGKIAWAGLLGGVTGLILVLTATYFLNPSAYYTAKHAIYRQFR